MITGVKGRIRDSEPGKISVETASGLIVRALVPVSAFPEFAPGEDVELFTTLRLKDDIFQLYGFLSRGQRSWFEELTAISGIGGKTALALISAFSDEELAEMVEAGDFMRLSSVPGIGRKTAQRVVLEMSGRLGRFGETDFKARGSDVENDLVSGLVNLGFSARAARDAVRKVLPPPGDSEQSFNVLLKQALKRISRQ